MAVYNLNGTEIQNIYNKSGNKISQAYDKSGNPLIGDSVLKVMQYNVGQFYIGDGNVIPTELKSTYSTLQTTIFNNHNPDICLMQESPRIFCADGTLSDDFLSTWFNQFASSRGGINYQAHRIATKGYTISNYQEIEFTHPYGNYPGYETCTMSINGHNILFVNTHMTTSQSEQESQCADILNAVSNAEYFIICGDFNTVISSLSDTDYINCIKPFVDAGYNTANCGSFGILSTYYATADPDASYKPATDQIIVSSNITIQDAYVDTTKLTDGIDAKIDHLPLIAELVIN